MDDPCTLYLRGKNDITLPGDIAECALTLAEIGAIAVLQCMVDGTSPAANPALVAEFQTVLPRLKERGILQAEAADGKLRLTIDLDAARA